MLAGYNNGTLSKVVFDEIRDQIALLNRHRRSGYDYYKFLGIEQLKICS